MSKEVDCLKKLMIMILIVFSIIVMGPFTVSADRSFTIDKVTIDAQIDEEGIMNVSELFTYTFDGSFQGMTRTIDSDVHGFKAYLVENHTIEMSKLLENAQPLTVEKEDHTFKTYSESKHETKHILYQYEVRGSVNKYADTADISYEFFDQ